MSSVTLLTLRTRVQQRGNYENSARFTPAYLNDQINIAWGELYEILSSVHQGYFDIESTLTTTANQDTVSLPADFWRLRGVDMQLDTTPTWVEMNQIGITERNNYVGASRPAAYRVASGGTRGTLKLYPTPDAVYTMRVVYEPTKIVLAGDSDAIEDFNGWADYVVVAALLRLDEREQRPLNDRLQMLERCKRRVTEGATERRAAEPEYLIPRSSASWGDDLY